MRENPLAVSGFEFVEFAAQDGEPLDRLFRQMGFQPVARHESQDVTQYRQGGINLLLNTQPDTFAAEFVKQHGPCCTGFALTVDDAKAAAESVKANGASAHDGAGTAPVDCPAIEGIGGSLLYLADRKDGSVLNATFEPLDGADPQPAGFGLDYIDHLTHNVYNGNMDKWADFYSSLFNFYEVKYFDIKGQQTGLRSRAMTAPGGEISIPINESSDPKSQINEYLDEYNGEGVQHIALYTSGIYETVESMHEQGIGFLKTPETYYDAIDERVPNHGEDIDRMRRNGILIDADQNDPSKQLLQIFTETNIGPIFFEIIQRKGNEGFGEGNFQALFEAIERDQQRRGVL